MVVFEENTQGTTFFSAYPRPQDRIVSVDLVYKINSFQYFI